MPEALRLIESINRKTSFESGTNAWIAAGGALLDAGAAYANSPASAELWWFKLLVAGIAVLPLGSMSVYQFARQLRQGAEELKQEEKEQKFQRVREQLEWERSHGNIRRYLR